MRWQVPLDAPVLNTSAQQTSTKIHIKSEPLTIIALSAAVSLTKFFAEKSKD